MSETERALGTAVAWLLKATAAHALVTEIGDGPMTAARREEKAAAEDEAFDAMKRAADVLLALGFV